MFKIILYLNVLLGTVHIHFAIGDADCLHYLHQVSGADSEFIKCVVNNSAPVTICKNCIQQYEIVKQAYRELLEAEIPSASEQIKCKELYLSKNHLNIVENTQKNVMEFWENAFCLECYDKDHPDSYEYNNHTKTMFRLLEDVNSCIVKQNTDACILCHAEYTDVNSYFDKLMKDTEGKVCFDVQDSMNRTRLLWSKEKKCCRRTRNLTLFSVVSTSLSIIPVLFYAAFYFYTKRQERNHPMLQSDMRFNDSLGPSVMMPGNSASRISSSSSGNSITADKSPFSKTRSS